VTLDPGEAVILARIRPGRPVEAQTEAAAKALRAAGWTVTIYVVHRKRDLRRRSREAVSAGVRLLAVVGGDGAVLQVLGAVAGTETVLGVLPLGTGNLVASNLGIPVDPHGAIDVLCSGAVRQLDLGRARVGGRSWHFAVACGAGLDAEVMASTNPAAKRRLGRLAYLASAVRAAVTVHEAEYRVKADGRPSHGRAAQVLVANLGRVASIEPRVPIDPADGQLELFVARAGSPAGVVAAIVEGLLVPGAETHGGARVSRRGVRKVRIHATPAQRVQVDGTAVGWTPVRVDVRPGALRVLVAQADPDRDAAPSA
jgi:diacylglycerol kinase family enzyme